MTASTAVFLASDTASYITGQTIHVDGGTQAAGGWYHHPDTGEYKFGPG
jgi:3-oxoacyl-[acyl-carrier protein] reductase